MGDRNPDKVPKERSGEWFGRVPRVSDALKRGTLVSVTTWGGESLVGLICDWEQTGLLLDVREPEPGSTGYRFLPWSSVQHVDIEEVEQRQVKFLQG